MSILICRTGDDEGQFHIKRMLSDEEEARLNELAPAESDSRIPGWGYDGDCFEAGPEFCAWINGPLDPAPLPAIATYLESLPE